MIIDKDEEPNHYCILGVHPSTSHEGILKAAKKKRIETHPDKFTKDGLSLDKLVKIIETAKVVGMASDVLCDPKKRQKYDAEIGI